MPTITIYLTKEQYDKVCDAPSKAVQAALEYYFKNADDLGTGFAQSEQSDQEAGTGENTANNE